MAASYQVSTPPAPSSLHTPSTPRWGDEYEPYSPRKSSRISQRSREAKTPPPQSHVRNSRTRSPQTGSTLTSSPPTASKPRTKKMSQNMGGRRVSGALTYDSTASAAAALGLPAPKNEGKVVNRSTATIANNTMLPTPDKTPAKRPSTIAPAVTGIARNLFVRPDEVMPTPKKKKGRKKYSGFTMDSFEAEEDSTPIAVFTDSHERIPEIDNSLDNPFYGEGAKVSAREGANARRNQATEMIIVEGEGRKSIEELERREDGLVYVFRGKKMFRKFNEDEVEDEEDETTEADAIALDIPSHLRRPLTRSTFKPRLLFPPKTKPTTATEDEEADTDIEEATTSGPDAFATPKTSKFASSFATPPTTLRATRSKKIEMDSSPGEPTTDDDAMVTSPAQPGSSGSGKVSPFDQWRRVKSKPVKGTKKRAGSPLTGRISDKKVRG